MKHLLLVLAVSSSTLASFTLAACGGGGDAAPTSTAGVSDGEVEIALSSSAAVRRGSNTFTLALSDRAGAVTAETIAVDPQMPSMGHGSSVTPRVTAQSAGLYRVEDVVFTMPGTWDVHVRITVEGRESARTFRYEIP